MKDFIVLIKLGKRDQTAVEVQKVLTKYGKSIKVRLGLHDFDSEMAKGLIVLQVLSLEDGKTIANEIEGLDELSVEVVEI